MPVRALRCVAFMKVMFLMVNFMCFRWHCAVLVGLCYLRQKNIRAKEHIEKLNACSSEFDIRLSFLCFASADAYSTALLLMIRTKV